MTLTTRSIRSLLFALMFALVLVVFTTPAQAHAAGLTSAQVNAVIGLLQAFDVPQATINQVSSILQGGTNTGSGVSSATIDQESLSTDVGKFNITGTASNTKKVAVFIAVPQYESSGSITDYAFLKGQLGKDGLFLEKSNVKNGRWSAQFSVHVPSTFKVVVFDYASKVAIAKDTLTVGGSNEPVSNDDEDEDEDENEDEDEDEDEDDKNVSSSGSGSNSGSSSNSGSGNNQTTSSAKPNTAQFMAAAKTDSSTASSVLYGVIGANTDLRDWTAIMASSDPLAAARAATAAMYNGTGNYRVSWATRPQDRSTTVWAHNAGNFTFYKEIIPGVGENYVLGLVDGGGYQLTSAANPDVLVKHILNFGFNKSDLSGLQAKLDAAGFSLTSKTSWPRGFLWSSSAIPQDSLVASLGFLPESLYETMAGVTDFLAAVEMAPVYVITDALSDFLFEMGLY